MNTDSDTEKKDEEYLKFAYEQSIIAYQHHVQRYGTWMNMYAVITGALFVAFYSIYGNGSGGLHDDLLLILISVLGFVCSLCWYGTVKGHYEWMKSFIEILKINEKRYFGLNNPNAPFVYSKVIAHENMCPKSGCYLYGFFSTQKITLLFISFVTFAWFFVILFTIIRRITLEESWPHYISLVFALSLLLALLLVFISLMAYVFGRILKRSVPTYFLSTILPNEIIKILNYEQK